MDYHIYLHNLNEGGQGNPTVPTPPDKPSMTVPDYSEEAGGGFDPRMALSTAAKAVKGTISPQQRFLGAYIRRGGTFSGLLH